jgi:hypothetical protein
MPKNFGNTIITSNSAARDAILILAGCVIVYLISRRFDLLEWFVDYSRAHENWELDEFATVAIFLMVCLGIFAWRRLRELRDSQQELDQKNHDLEQALNEVKELKGLIPICVSCKSIRDDEGYWHQVESYITNHTHASFTHGICPDCMRRLYPDYVDKAEESSDNQKPAPNSLTPLDDSRIPSESSAGGIRGNS